MYHAINTQLTTQSYRPPVKMGLKLFMKNAVTFFLWTITSFICHWSARRFLRGWKNEAAPSQLILSSLLTIAQSSLFCVCGVTSLIKTKSTGLFWIKIVSHVLATFFTNYSMVLIAASSTFTVKLLEPVTSAIAQRIFQNDPVYRISLISLSIMIFGAIMFCSDDMTHLNLNQGMIFAFASNLILATRNVAIRMEETVDTTKVIKNENKFKLLLTSILLCICSVVGIISFVQLDSLERVLYLSISSVLHLIYSYISTNIVLKLSTILGHAVLNVCKRMLVVISLYLIGDRKASPSNWLGLILFSLACSCYFLSSNHAKIDSSLVFNRVCRIGGRIKQYLLVFLVLVIVIVFSRLISKTTAFNPKMKEHYQPYRRALFNSKNSTTQTSDMYHSTQFISNVNNVSQYWKTSDEIVKEAQTIHLELFSRLLKPYKYVMLLDIAVIENKGDPAITVGELLLLRRLNKILVFYCNFHKCTEKNLRRASRMSKFFTPRKLIILLHGGGNLVGWVVNDHLRQRIFEHFKGFQFLLFPQSIFMKGTQAHLAFCEKIYRYQPNLTMVLRDRNSLELAKKHFGGSTKLLMAPDMAFQIGSRRRFMMPFYDILWICRTDLEKVDGHMPPLPKNVSIKVDDWLNWKTPGTGNDVEKAHLLLNNGFVFVQRGRVVITDRLHGHILSTLMDIPHVIVNNKWNKVSNYHNTWTMGHKNTRVANNQSHAIDLAITMLGEYASTLPQTVPFMNVMDEL